MIPELSRPLAPDGLAEAGEVVVVEATPAERAALARRMRLPAINSLRCRFDLTPGAASAVAAAGRLEADVVQTCVVSLEDFTATIAEDFAVVFVAAGSETAAIDPDSADEIPYAGGVLDLGEAAAEQLALALDPYPHAPEATLPELGADEEAPMRPFARLSPLRRPQ